MNNPQIITKIKISKEKWLNQKIKYENNISFKQILEDMCLETYEWMSNKDDFNIIIDYDSFKTEFINLMYNKYLNE